MIDGGYDYTRYGGKDLKQTQLMAIGPATEFRLHRKPQPKVVKSTRK